MIKLYRGDCLKLFMKLPVNRIALVLADPPYEFTNNRWDNIIPMGQMWEGIRRVRRFNGVTVLTANQPFTSQLIASNRREYKYVWTWNKSHKAPTGFLNAKKQPLRVIEDVAVFYIKQPTYNPIFLRGEPYIKLGRLGYPDVGSFRNYGSQTAHMCVESAALSGAGLRYPTNLISCEADLPGEFTGRHSTQKPIALMEYFIKTYTNKGDVVLDFCMGVGSTGVACVNLRRSFIGFEADRAFYDIAKKRIVEQLKKM